MTEIKLFELTQKILEESESYILNYKIQTKAGFWFSKHLIFPIKFLLMGFGEFFKPFIKWSFLSLAFILVGSLIIGDDSAPSEVESIIFSLCFYVPIALVMFSVPSTYAYYGVLPENVKAIVEYLESLNIQELETIDALQANLENIHSRINNRISAYKWLIGASWVFFTYLLNQQINLVLKISPDSWQSFIENNILTFAVFLFISIACVGIVASYKRASELLVKTLEFGFIEIKHKLQMAKIN